LKWAFTIWNRSELSEGDYEALRRAGFEVAEVSLDYPWPFSVKFRTAVAELKKRGFALAFHAPWRDILLASPYEEVARGSLEALKRVISEVERYEPLYIVVHVQTREEVGMEEDYLMRVENALAELNGFASANNIRVLIENAFGVFGDSPEVFRKLLDSAGVGACLDVGRLLPRPYQNSFPLDTIEKWLSTIGDRVEVLHIHTVGRRMGRPAEHFSIAGSEILFSTIVKKARALNPEITVTLEIFYTHLGTDATPSYIAETLTRLLPYI